MKWEGINEFVYVSETESFTKAARRMSISTAQVSRQVSALENRLNIKLFYRTTRKISLTQEGHIFYQHCRLLLNGLEDAKRAISNLQDRPRGMIKLTAPVSYGEQQILPLVNDFMLLYPDIEVFAYLGNQQVDLVGDGYDLAIRIGKLSDSTMMAKKLSVRSNYVCASPFYLEKYGTPLSLLDLNQHNCLMGVLDHWHFKENGIEKKIRVKGNLRYNSGWGLADAALKSQGIVQLPDCYVQKHLDSGTLMSILEHCQEPDESIWAVYPHNRHLCSKIRLLVDFLADNLS